MFFACQKNKQNSIVLGKYGQKIAWIFLQYPLAMVFFCCIKQGSLHEASESTMTMKKEAGFTLVELLTIVTIIGVMSGIIGINMAAEVKKNRLKEATTRFYSDIKKCRVDSMSKTSNTANILGLGFQFSNATTYQTFEFNDITSPSYTFSAGTEKLNPVTVEVPNGVQVRRSSGTLTDPFFFDRRGWLRNGTWSSATGATYVLELTGVEPRCVVLSTSQIRQGVWKNGTTCVSN